MTLNNDRIWPSITSGVLTGAYGRQYTSKEEVLKDFRMGKDFRINWHNGSTYCSIRDCQPDEMVKFRFNSDQKACFYVVTQRDLSQLEKPNLTEVKG